MKKKLSVELGELPDRNPSVRTAAGTVEKSVGLEGRTLASGLARRYGIDEEPPAVVIVRVDPLGSGDRAGIRVGDQVVSVGGTTVRTEADFRAALGKADLATGVRLKIRRDGQDTYVLLHTAR